MSALFVVHLAHWALGLAVRFRAEEIQCGWFVVILFGILALIEYRAGVQQEEESKS